MQICYLCQFIMQYFIYLVTTEMCLVKKANNTYIRVCICSCTYLFTRKEICYKLTLPSLRIWVCEDVTWKKCATNMCRLVSYLCRIRYFSCAPSFPVNYLHFHRVFFGTLSNIVLPNFWLQYIMLHCQYLVDLVAFLALTTKNDHESDGGFSTIVRLYMYIHTHMCVCLFIIQYSFLVNWC